MKIWLLKTGEELPIDPGTPRLLRMGIIGDMLADRGHEVTYWTSTFSHTRKVHRFHADTELLVRDNYRIKLIHSPGYRKNLSISRIYDHWLLARKFRHQAPSEDKPDIIFCAMPTIDFSLAATEYGVRYDVPVVLDLRDMWPDIFMETLPTWAKGMGRVGLTPMYNNLKKSCKKATALFGITDHFLNWGLKYAGRERSDLDAVYFHGYKGTAPEESLINEAKSFWKKHGISKECKKFVVCFFGYFGRQFELNTVFEAARKLKNLSPEILFVLCGQGDNFGKYKEICRDLKNVVLPGFVGYAEIWTLMRMSAVGLAPYRSTHSFEASLPNKVSEYHSAGLPIVSSLAGTLESVLAENGCGITYSNTDSESLANILVDLQRDRQKLLTMAENSRRLFQNRFDAENIYVQMIRHLDSIVKKFSLRPR